MEAARAGDEQAFGRLFDRWFDPVYDVAWRILRNPDNAAEVAQDVFLAAWKGLDGLDQPGSFGGWVRRIARNRALNRLDRERRSVPDDEQAAAALDRSAPDVDLTAALGERDQKELVWAAAQALGERDASLLDLHLRHGLGAGEIADEMGVTPNNAHQLLHRLKGKLRRAIEAWVLWGGARARCPGLDGAVLAAGVVSFGADAVRVIGRHADGCDECSERQQLRLAPEALFAALPMMTAPPLLKAEAFTALAHAGVPMGGSLPSGPSSDTGSAGEAGTGSTDGGGGASSDAGAGPGGEGGANAGAGDVGAGDADAGDAGAGDGGGVDAGGDAGAGDGGGADAGGGAGAADGDTAAQAEAGGGSDGGAEIVGDNGGSAAAGPPTGDVAVGGHPGSLGDAGDAGDVAVAAPEPLAPGLGAAPGRDATGWRRRGLAALGLLLLLALVGVGAGLLDGGPRDTTEVTDVTPAPDGAEADDGDDAETSEAAGDPVTTPPDTAPVTVGATTTDPTPEGDGSAVPGDAGGDPGPDPEPGDGGGPPPSTAPPATPPPTDPAPAPTIGALRATVTSTPCGSGSTGPWVVTVVWQSLDADRATLTGPDGVVAVPPSGTATRCAEHGDTFTLDVTGPGGSDTGTAVVR